jgi:hypothetical protein
MPYKPDYGLRLMKEGYSASIDINFYDFRLYSISVLGRGQYSTMVEMPYGGITHALSLDFNRAQLEQILKGADHTLRAFVQRELQDETPRTIDLPGETSFGVRARLGSVQTVQKEQFVPLVAQEIM